MFIPEAQLQKSLIWRTYIVVKKKINKIHEYINNYGCKLTGRLTVVRPQGGAAARGCGA